MGTSIRIPAALLKEVDRRARALRVSRNRLILRALERELEQGSEWSAGFFEKLRTLDRETLEDAELMLASIRERRRSKGPPNSRTPPEC
jgi:predicted transcriptional regulator